jgi:hypothetical protein
MTNMTNMTNTELILNSLWEKTPVFFTNLMKRLFYTSSNPLLQSSFAYSVQTPSPQYRKQLVCDKNWFFNYSF